MIPASPALRSVLPFPSISTIKLPSITCSSSWAPGCRGQPQAFENASVGVRQLYHGSIGRRHRVVIEVHVAVGLGPEPDATGDGLRKRVLQVKLAVEIGRDLGPGDTHLEVMPLAGRRRRVANPFDRGSLSFLEFP